MARFPDPVPRLRRLLAGVLEAGSTFATAGSTLATFLRRVRVRRPRLPPARDLLRAAGVAAAAFILVNVVGEALRPPFDTLGVWVAWPSNPEVRRQLGVVVAVALLASALVRSRPPWLRFGSAAVFGAVAVAASLDVARFARALSHGRVVTSAPVPSSAFVAVFFGLLAWEAAGARLSGRAPDAPPGHRGRVARLAVIGAVLAALPLLQMATFGPSRYERQADCAVVFGARVWRTGRPSQALADRVDEAIDLYRRGLVRRIVMSGAIDDDVGFSEPAVMAARAEAAGVPRDAIVLDEAGVDTASTVRNTARMMRREGLSKALVVTHYYHEPRAKMLFNRAGIRAYTVPAHMTQRLRKEPYFLLREVAAYYHSFLLE